MRNSIVITKQDTDQSAGAVEYTDCISSEGKTPPHKCPGYDTKQSDGEVVEMQSTPFFDIVHRSTLAWRGGTW